MVHKKISAFLLISLFILLSGCTSEKEVNRLKEEAYNNGYYDALDCVKRKGGSANSAAEDCDNE